MNPDSAHSNSINGRLAEYLIAQKEEIVREWLDRVSRDPAIPTDTLTTAQLRDHLPLVFEDLSQTLRHYGSVTVAEQSGKDAAKHGEARWQQGYEIPTLLREFQHLRTVFIYHLKVFEEANPNFGVAARIFATSTVHGFLDAMAIEASEQFQKPSQT